MTPEPKEKAKEFVEKFRLIIAESDLHIPEYFKDSMDYKSEEMNLAKEYALLCVDEMIEEFMWFNTLVSFNDANKKNVTDKIEHFKSVKTEIENLC